jgi:hypothetical protein
VDRGREGRGLTGRARRRRRLAHLALAAVVAAGIPAAAAGVITATGDYDTFGPAFLDERAAPVPAWARVCRHAAQKPGGRPFVLRCLRVHGTVLWVQHHDPDGDGDRHVLVVAGLHLVKVKYRRAVHVDLPSRGSTITVAGVHPRRRSGPFEVLDARPAR